MKGYSLIEITLVISIFIILVGLATINLYKFQHTDQLSSAVNSFFADYKSQQLKAMIGETDGTGSVSSFGVHFETSSYTLFQNTYGTNNFSVNLPAGTQLSTTLSNSQVVFMSGSGEVSGFINGQNTIIFKDTVDNSTKTVTINRYGVVTALN
jgi:type II secretory pathway pseudopilin PulG